MDKYEFRRQQLIKIRDEKCDGKAVNVARKIGREPSYVSRMLYPEGKKGKKRIADDYPVDGWMVSFHHQRTQPPVMKQGF